VKDEAECTSLCPSLLSDNEGKPAAEQSTCTCTTGELDACNGR
jgi:hypothetical protein